MRLRLLQRDLLLVAHALTLGADWPQALLLVLFAHVLAVVPLRSRNAQGCLHRLQRVALVSCVGDILT